jgi:drug/metabolite transporter (DMT)-like permease
MSSSSSFSLGVSAAVFAPLVMTLGFLVWENTWTGSTYSLNLFKCCLASLWFLLVSIGTRRLLPTTTSLNEVFTVQSVGYLMLSSTLGILIGDWLWLEGLRLLGAKKVLVVDTLKPFFAAFLGWILLGETIRLPAIGGMMLTVIGVLMVSIEPNQTTTTTTPDSTTSTKTSSTITNPSPNDIQSSHIGDTDSLELPPTHTIPLTPVNDRLIDQEAIINLSEISGLKSTPTTKTCDSETKISPEVSYSTTISPSTTDAKTKFHQSSHSEDKADSGLAPTSISSQDVVCKTLEKNVSHHQTKNHSMNSDDAKTSNLSNPAPPCANTPLDINRCIPPITLQQIRTQSITSERQGYICSVLNVVLDTYGSILTKQYGIKLSTWEISGIRFGFAGMVMLIGSIAITFYHHRKSNICQSSYNQQSSQASNSIQRIPWYQLPTHSMGRLAWCKTTVGVAMVTFLTPAMTNYALFQIPLALALTLGSIGPLYALPLVWLMQGDKPSFQAAFGAAMAVFGVIILSFFGSPGA